jgi:thiamine biosynthesis lipoprotein
LTALPAHIAARRSRSETASAVLTRLSRAKPLAPDGSREVERVLARLDRALSTWRPDSDASRFNQAPAGEWIDVTPDLAAIVAFARRVHRDTDGAFDITAGAGRIGAMCHLESRVTPPALRKIRADVVVDLGGIGPGYAVDRLGEQLQELGSSSHLVELGGEVRAWGEREAGEPWRVVLRHTRESMRLAAGEALATSTARASRSPVDPRTGRVVAPAVPVATVRAATCAEADAWAVAVLVLGGMPDGVNRVSEAPSTRAGPTAARQEDP